MKLNSNHYLCLFDRTDVPSGYEDYLWIDEGCVEGIQWCEKQNIKFHVIEGYWKTDEDIQKSLAYLKKVKAQALIYAKDLLNSYHNTDFIVSEWEIMLSQWLDNYIVLFFDKYIRLKQIEEGGRVCECELFDVENLSVPLDYMEYMRLAQRSEKFHGYQYAQLVSIMTPLEKIKATECKPYLQDVVPVPQKTRGYYKTDIYKFITETYKNLAHSQEKVVLQESYLPNNFLLEAMMRRPGVISNYVIDYHRHEKVRLSRHLDLEWRNKKDAIPQGTDEFTKMICQLLKWNLPIACVEDFQYLQKRVKKLYKHAMHPKAVLYACVTGCDEMLKTYLMTVRRSGTKFYNVQHGGNYGIDIDDGMYNEMEISDYLYTWGWDIEEGFPCKCRPMPAAKLMRDGLQNVKKGNDILYINYVNCKHICNLSKKNIFYKKAKEAELQFLKSLSPSVKKQLVVRLYQNDFGWKIREDIEKDVSDIRFDEEPDYYKSLNRAKCVVAMCWYTTVLEAFYANKPIVVLREDGLTETSALMDLQELEEVGILVKNWETLAKRLEEISGNIDEWWNEPKRKAVVQKMRDKYTYMPKNAKEIWMKELLRLADE